MKEVLMRIVWVFIASVLMMAGCSPGPRPPDLASEERAIRDMDARWLKSANDRDAAAQAAMYTPDGVSYHDGEEPATGQAAIQAWEAKSAAKNPKAVLTYERQHLYVASAADVAVETGIGAISHLGPNGEDATVHRSALVTVWKKVNGEWKVWQDIASDVP
jgi:uncharacterized protein (TIGR02246 family)